MGNQFLSSLEVMTSRSQCPTVLLDAETVRLFRMIVCTNLNKTDKAFAVMLCMFLNMYVCPAVDIFVSCTVYVIGGVVG